MRGCYAFASSFQHAASPLIPLRSLSRPATLFLRMRLEFRRCRAVQAQADDFRCKYLRKARHIDVDFCSTPCGFGGFFKRSVSMADPEAKSAKSELFESKFVK